MNNFQKRLHDACRLNASIPEYGKGQQTYIAEKMSVSQEAVRKWFSGDSQPRQAMLKRLAEVLGVKHSWLALGTAHGEIEADIATARRHEAGVYGLMGFIIAKGQSATFQTEHEYCDLLLIHEGRPVHVAVETAEPENDLQKKWLVTFKTVQLDKAIAVAFVGLMDTEYSAAGYFLEVPPEVAVHHGVRVNNGVTVTIEYDARSKAFRVNKTKLKKFLEQ
tara:strand:- start:86 stop:745 length:660 start_codon:yes stop_codon:yes gene_type:complete